MQLFFHNCDIPSEIISKGIRRKILSHSRELMICELEFETGAIGELHKHFHAQCTYIISGVFEFEINGVKEIIKAGDSAYKQPNVIHGCVCLEKGKLIDVFTQ